MNAPQHTPDDDQLFDLLVDDELGEAERRELLARLDHVPDGWRRCALTFLEAQCWKKELGAMAREPAQVVRPAPPALDKKRPAFRWGTALAMAASFLVALGLGSVLRDAWHRGGPAPGQVATMVSEPQSPAPAGGPAAVKAEPTNRSGSRPWNEIRSTRTGCRAFPRRFRRRSSGP